MKLDGQMAAPGFLAVFTDPGAEATLEEFQDWYDNEHVPLRLNHLRSFVSCARYSAVDGKHPGWAAMYEIESVASFSEPSYAVLRDKRSEREGELVLRLGMLDRRTAEVVVDTGEQPEKSSGLHFGNPSKFIVTFGLEATPDKLQELSTRTRSLPDWVRTRIVKVFDKGVMGRNEEWTKINVLEYMGMIELTSQLSVEQWEKAVGGQLPDDWRQWIIYRAFPSIAQGNVELK